MSETSNPDANADNEAETVTVELPRERVAEIKPRKLLPDDYDETGFAGSGPIGIVGQHVHGFSVTKMAVDTFVEGAPEGCPYETKAAVLEHTEPGSDDRREYLYGAGERQECGHIYFCEAPEECPFCGADIDRVVGSLIEYRGVTNCGVTHCPECQRIYGEY